MYAVLVDGHGDEMGYLEIKSTTNWCRIFFSVYEKLSRVLFISFVDFVLQMTNGGVLMV